MTVALIRRYFMETRRLGFANWEPNDLAVAKRIWRDPAITASLGAPKGFTEEACRARFAAAFEYDKKLEMSFWPLFQLRDNALVGGCGLRPVDGHYELGFDLIPSARRKGYAREAADAVIHYAFDTMMLDHLVATPMSNNMPARRVLEMLGFTSTTDTSADEPVRMQYELQRSQLN